jgi:lipopolysaccharide export system protein LptC
VNRIYYASLIFFAFSAISYSVVRWHQAKNQDNQVARYMMTPDFIAESLKSKIYDKLGTLFYIIDAKQMEHYARTEVTYFELPKYTLYPKNSVNPWKISANKGTLDNNNRVKLEDRVSLKATDNDSLIQEIHGKYLELDLNTNIISSEQTIYIKGKGFTIYGSGLIVDLNTKQMTLKQHVQTTYKNTK